jgi:hypothetical protein
MRKRRHAGNASSTRSSPAAAALALAALFLAADFMVGYDPLEGVWSDKLLNC